MKTFWSIIGVLVIATAAVWVINGGAFRSAGKPAPQTPQPPAAAAPSPRPSTPEAVREPEPAPTPSPNAPDPVQTTPAPAATAVTPPTGHNAYHGAGGALPAAGGTGQAGTPAAKIPSDSPLSGLNDLLLKGDPKSEGTASSPAKPAGTTAEDPAKPAATTADKGPVFTLGPVTDVKQEDDGWTRLDGRYLVRGAGTPTDPMVVPWELLVSASESFRPRSGLKEMPRRVADLKGKHVKITGYVLFPLMSMETTEVLLMRNQWDGCCIGVPPTPYDAVEVKLAKPADRKDSLLSFVTIEGVIDVDPYLNKDFLLGLYTLSEGTLSQPAKGKDDDRGL